MLSECPVRGPFRQRVLSEVHRGRIIFENVILAMFVGYLFLCVSVRLVLLRWCALSEGVPLEYGKFQSK